MANTEGCCDRELGSANSGRRNALRKAIKRAAKAQRRLNETIYRAQACGQSSSSSSSESDAEPEGNRGRGRCARESFTTGSHRYQRCQRMSGHGLRNAHGAWPSMRGFPAGRHTMGFPGMMPHMGAHSQMHRHHHQHHHHHPLHDHWHRHHHRGHFGPPHSFPGKAGPFGCGGRGGHGPIGRPFPNFGGMGQPSGQRGRAHSFSGF